MIVWDERKNEANRRKHGVSFELAGLVFSDPLHLSRQDRLEKGELRWQTIGMVGNVLLMIAHTVEDTPEGGTYSYRLRPARDKTGKKAL